MEKIIFIKIIFIYWNVLDSYNFEFLKVGILKIKWDYILIFYGIGIKVYNLDFNELVVFVIV